MRKHSQAAVLVVLLFSAPAAQSDTPSAKRGVMTGLEFLRICEGTAEGTEQMGRVICESYLGGFWAAQRLATAVCDGEDRKRLCFPDEGLPADQMRLIVVKWLKEHPERLQERSDVLNFTIIFETYACKRK